MLEILKYKEFLKTSILKEFRGKYKKSFLGILWSFINPLLQLLVYSLVFSFIMKAEIPHFTSFLVVALIPWNFFNITVVQSASTIIANAGILKKVYFPREILPISIVTSNLINFLISCIIIFAALLISGIGVSKYIIYLPLVILIEYLISLSFAFIISACTVFIRDLEYFISILMMLWFYFCPIVYSAELIPSNLKNVFMVNPMLHIINGYRDILYYQSSPQLKKLSVLLIFSIIAVVISYKIFKKLEKGFVEEL